MEKHQRLMSKVEGRLETIMDEVNGRFGRGTLGITVSGQRQIWRIQSKWRFINFGYLVL